MANVLRILDANANRAREALRVMEEAARFLLNDTALAADVKQLRHDLASCLSAVLQGIGQRDTENDVGTSITTESEAERACVADVVIAAGKRLSEALRAIEEYGKTIVEVEGCAALPTKVERLRYRGYTLEQRLALALRHATPSQWSFCLLLTQSLCTHHGWDAVLEQALEAGADCVQVREKSLASGEFAEYAREVVTRCRGRAAVIVNDRPDVAMLVGADGVHIGQNDLSCRDARRLFGRQLIVGVSTSCLKQAEQAQADGADYCGVGPMFETATKHKDVIVGPAYLREYVAWGGLPHLAIGGISPGNVNELVEAGVRGVAVSGAVCGAREPGAVVESILAPMRRATEVAQPAR